MSRRGDAETPVVVRVSRRWPLVWSVVCEPGTSHSLTCPSSLLLMAALGVPQGYPLMWGGN